MVVLGIVLLAGAAVFAVSAIVANTGAVEVDLWGTSVSNLSLGSVFALGMVTAVVGLAGLFLVTTGVRRGVRLRRERRMLARENRRLTREAGSSAAAPEPAPSAEPDADRSDKQGARHRWRKVRIGSGRSSE